MHTSTRLHHRIRGLLALLLTLALLGLAPQAQAASGDCTTSGTIVTCTFDFTGAAETWIVPAGVTSVTIQALGAQGRGEMVVLLLAQAPLVGTAAP
jgi:hypothetical protein